MGHRVAEQPLRKLALRIVSSIILIVATCAVIWFGPPAFDLFILTATIVLAWEWSRLCGQSEFSAPVAVLYLTMILVVAVTAFIRPAYGLAACGAGTLAVFAVASAARADRAVWLSLGTLYIGLPALALLWISRDPVWGRETLALAIATVAATDTAAYFVGRAVGGPRLAPVISPNKTWAGLAGGFAGGAVAGAVVCLIVGAPYWLGAGLGAALAAISQTGDLFESAVKRRFGVKDSGVIIPGHGGLFDRVDGHIAAVCAVAAANWVSGGSVLTWR